MNFGGIAKEYTNPRTSLFSVIPVPYDLTSTYGTGARLGPAAILNASANMELYDEHLGQETYLAGIHTDEAIAIDARGPEQMIKRVYSHIKKHLAATRVPVLLGGEHSISLGAVQAAYNFYPEVTVLHFDAHADLRNSYQNSCFSHASVARRMAELCSVVQVGVRSISAEDAAFMKSCKRVETFLAEHIHSHPHWQAQVLSLLKGDIYITIDLDVFDPSIMPSTGTPEPNGLLWRDVVPLLEEVTRHHRVVGFDVVELAPLPGIVAPDFLVAKLIYSLMGFISKYR